MLLAHDYNVRTYVFQHGAHGPTRAHNTKYERYEFQRTDQPIIGQQPARRVFPIHGTYGKNNDLISKNL